MLNKNITPIDALETAVLRKDNAGIVDLIAEGAFLTRPDVLATKQAFDLYLNVAMLLIESAHCLRTESAVRRLEELDADRETLDLVRETTLPLFENDHPESEELMNAIAAGDEDTVEELIVDEDVTLYSADLKIFDGISGFSENTIVLLLDYGVFGRLQAQIFLNLREKAKKECSDRDILLFETMKIIIKEFDSDEREQRIHELWKAQYIKAIAAEPEKYTDECLADLINDKVLDFNIRPFKAFAPCCQVLLLNNGGVTPEQFEKEAAFEKFDAETVFELLSNSDKYANRINWEQVNKTAAASAYLEFLDEHPQYADKADWQMLTKQVAPRHWIMLLQKHPEWLEMYQAHSKLYSRFHMFWEGILQKSGISYGNCFALFKLDYPDYRYCFKVKINNGEAEFFEINDPEAYQTYAALAEYNFESFCAKLKNPDLDNDSLPEVYNDGEERFVPIIQ